MIKRKHTKDDKQGFPVKDYSYASLVMFTSNPVLFKVIHINGDRFDTTTSISRVIGQAFHKAVEIYHGGNDDVPITDEAEGIEQGLKIGSAFIENYNDGFMEFSSTVPTKQKALEMFVFAFNSYVQENNIEPNQIVGCEEKIQEYVNVEWRGQKLELPIRLKGYTDLVIRKDRRLKIVDYKTTKSFSDPDRIDGAKMIQAVQYYLLAYAKYGEEPYSIIFEEVKTTKNRDGGPQIRRYEIVYGENDLYFDFYFRLYQDVTDALSGKMVYVPNVMALFDNEVALISYIHRLDVSSETAKLLKKHKVDNITDLLKAKIQRAGNMRKLLKSVESKFMSAKNLNYEKMENHEKIQTKMLEYGMMLQYHSTISGASVDLYRYTPSIGLKMSRLKQFADDIEQVLGISGIRVVAPISGTTLVGYEVPKEKRIFPTLPSIGRDFEFVIGQDIMGKPHRFDVREAPHMLVAGASGAGKSVFLNSLIRQLDAQPKKAVEIALFDPKIVELGAFQNSKNVVDYQTNIMNINNSLKEIVDEMNSRYKALATAKVKDIQHYQGKMPYKFVIIDEFGDLVMQDYIHKEIIHTDEIYKSGPKQGQLKTRVEKTNISDEISKNVLLLAQKGRACGIHIIISTQRPSTDVITGTIKANFPTKVVFRTAKAIDSVVVIDEAGAEKLLGKGDMIFSSHGGNVRLQGYFCE